MKNFAYLLTLITAASAFAQNVPPPPRPVDGGPSLAETMKFVQQKLGDQGPVNFVSYLHDNVKGTDWTETRKIEVTNVRPSADGCRLDFHFAFTSNLVAPMNLDTWFALNAVTEIEVMSLDQRQRQTDTKAGHPEITTKVDPPVFVLVVRRPNNGFNDFYFFDESLANRVAKALLHGIELCGGGSKEPF